MSYILTLKDKPEGVFSIVDRDSGDHVVPIFDELDDCERYAIQLTECETGLQLALVEIDKNLIVGACEQRDQKYAIITVDDFIIPPDEFP
ncbi:hypothetical protein SXBG_00178 [Synechococcus phage S-CAM1]|jgi:hypothetical protein|uniref:Uncharacterized protein n=1 Tax=Synechococcus phage S-CAM1 TaxID=754037 RepID=M4QFB4_9CAUD|nr:hypothetical protein SXBG_00178 [Synechococcus phage S-CAM1]AGH26913.1 hypothetical protein SXBG_00178 [Synechococcus phage S-CAM1]AOV57410.1 hypothetical protein N330309_155 [Synechococcus phage S-CAM1]AOV57660.1 hypothetical protein N170310_155 [Synechococcus phage S-CAM1]AOV57910.1 hypothetical protein C030809_155 [Synechococcus phage S-CAM1]AOV58160.1 hypothetical protein S170810_155 [Synechococcus phage S-CAM1]